MAQLNINFHSYSIGVPVEIELTLPSVSSCDGRDGTQPSHKLAAKFPVLYLLHGAGNDYHCWTRYTSAERYAEEQQIAIVTCSVGNSRYHNREGARGEKFFDFLSKELPEFLTSYFPISDRPEDTYIAGLSMGGYGTFIHGFSHPERFAAMCPLSAAVSMGSRDGEEFDPTTDPESLAEAIVKSGKKFPKLYIACGKQDFLYEANVKFRDKLISMGADVTWDETEEHGHEWRFWDLELEKALKWLPRTDAYAGSARKV